MWFILKRLNKFFVKFELFCPGVNTTFNLLYYLYIQKIISRLFSRTGREIPVAADWGIQDLYPGNKSTGKHY